MTGSQTTLFRDPSGIGTSRFAKQGLRSPSPLEISSATAIVKLNMNNCVANTFPFLYKADSGDVHRKLC